MLNHLLRKLLYSIPLLIGINLLTFMLFFMVNTPDDIAHVHLGNKYVTQDEINDWKAIRGYDKPLFVNENAQGAQQLTETIFYQKSLKLFQFDFGISDGGNDISHEVFSRMGPSLAIALPTLIIGLLVDISAALIVVFFRRSYLDTLGVCLCVAMMSISSLFYIVGGQFIMAKMLKWVPISGFEYDIDALKFIILPIIIGIIGGVGSGVRWYRTLFLEEMGKDYVRTARAKGLSELKVLFKHVLRNALIPILTGVVVILPLLFLGSLLMESFFGIPGLGSYTIDAISQQDFAIVRAMVFLGSILYILGLMLTDLSYTLADPRVRFDK